MNPPNPKWGATQSADEVLEFLRLGSCRGRHVEHAPDVASAPLPLRPEGESAADDAAADAVLIVLALRAKVPLARFPRDERQRFLRWEEDDTTPSTLPPKQPPAANWCGHQKPVGVERSPRKPRRKHRGSRTGPSRHKPRPLGSNAANSSNRNHKTAPANERKTPPMLARPALAGHETLAPRAKPTLATNTAPPKPSPPLPPRDFSDRGLSSPAALDSSQETNCSIPHQQLERQETSGPNYDLPMGRQEMSGPNYDLPMGKQEMSQPNYDLPMGRKEMSKPNYDLPIGSQEMSRPSYDLPIGSHEIPRTYFDWPSGSQETAWPINAGHAGHQLIACLIYDQPMGSQQVARLFYNWPALQPSALARGRAPPPPGIGEPALSWPRPPARGRGRLTARELLDAAPPSPAVACQAPPPPPSVALNAPPPAVAYEAPPPPPEVACKAPPPPLAPACKAQPSLPSVACEAPPPGGSASLPVKRRARVGFGPYLPPGARPAASPGPGPDSDQPVGRAEEEQHATRAREAVPKCGNVVLGAVKKPWKSPDCVDGTKASRYPEEAEAAAAASCKTPAFRAKVSKPPSFLAGARRRSGQSGAPRVTKEAGGLAQCAVGMAKASPSGRGRRGRRSYYEGQKKQAARRGLALGARGCREIGCVPATSDCPPASAAVQEGGVVFRDLKDMQVFGADPPISK